MGKIITRQRHSTSGNQNKQKLKVKLTKKISTNKNQLKISKPTITARKLNKKQNSKLRNQNKIKQSKKTIKVKSKQIKQSEQKQALNQRQTNTLVKRLTEFYELYDSSTRPENSELIELQCPLNKQIAETLNGRHYERAQAICLQSTRFTFSRISFNNKLLNKLYKLQSNSLLLKRITKIKYVLNPTLLTKFELETKNQKNSKNIKYLWHSTLNRNINSIIANGFYSPSHPNYKLANGQAYGKGIYFSEDPAVCFHYAENVNRKSCIFLCIVFVGNCFSGSLGNYWNNSDDDAYNGTYHSNQVGDTVVSFKSEYIVPLYLIHFQDQ